MSMWNCSEITSSRGSNANLWAFAAADSTGRAATFLGLPMYISISAAVGWLRRAVSFGFFCCFFPFAFPFLVFFGVSKSSSDLYSSDSSSSSSSSLCRLFPFLGIFPREEIIFSLKVNLLRCALEELLMFFVGLCSGARIEGIKKYFIESYFFPFPLASSFLPLVQKSFALASCGCLHLFVAEKPSSEKAHRQPWGRREPSWKRVLMVSFGMVLV